MWAVRREGRAGASGIPSVIRPDGTGLRALPHMEGGEYPSWSPDGSRIAFNSNLTGDHVMYIAEADGSKVVDLSSAGEGWQVDWSPDGRCTLFTSHRDHPDNYTDVYVMPPDGSDVRRLTHQRAYTPGWSPDGEAHRVLGVRPVGCTLTRSDEALGRQSPWGVLVAPRRGAPGNG